MTKKDVGRKTGREADFERAIRKNLYRVIKNAREPFTKETARGRRGARTVTNTKGVSDGGLGTLAGAEGRALRRATNPGYTRCRKRGERKKA